MTTKLDKNLYSLITLHRNMKRHIRSHFDKSVFNKWRGCITVCYNKISCRIHRIKPYVSDTNVEDINLKN